MDDIVVVPSDRRLYMLALLPLHNDLTGDQVQCGSIRPRQFETLVALLHELVRVYGYAHVHSLTHMFNTETRHSCRA